MEQLSGNRPLGSDNSFNLAYTYGYINNNNFYPIVPAQYYNYYNRMVRQYFYWYDGYVPWFHNQNTGMFSTNTANDLMKGLAEVTTGGKLMYNYKSKETNYKKKGKTSIEFTNSWSEENDFSNLVNQSFEYAYAGGDSMLVLNQNDDGDLWIDLFRKDNYYLDTDYRGKIIDVTYLLYTYTKTTHRHGQETSDTYYLLERRYFDEDTDKPMLEIYVKRMQGMITSNKSVDVSPNTVSWDSLPSKVQKSIKRDFGFDDVGISRELPFEDHLGCYLIKATKALSFIPASPFGQSLLHNITSYLMTFDYYYSAMNTDIYTGRAHVMLPQTLQQPDFVGGSTSGGYYNGNFNRGFDSYLYNKVEFGDPDHQKPTLIQFDIRSKTWDEIRNHLIETIASKLRVSVKTIANYLNQSTNVTAREISTEEHMTSLFVESKRSINTPTINKILSDVLDYYGYREKDYIVVKFSKAGLTNISNLTQVIIAQKQNGLIDDETALKRLNPDADDAQIEDMMSKIPSNYYVGKEGILDETDKPIDEKTQDMNNTDVSHLEKPKSSIVDKVKNVFKK